MPKKSASALVQAYWPLVLGVAGAIWAISTFWLKDAPLLAVRVAGSSNLTWSATPDLCRAYFNVEFENNGTTAFSVSKVRIRAWLVDPPSLKSGGVFLDVPSSLNNTTPFTNVVYSSDLQNEGAVPPPLVATYHSGMQYKHRFEWDLPRTERRNFYVYVELFTPDSNSQKTKWYFSGWSQVCESAEKSSGKSEQRGSNDGKRSRP